MFLHVLVFQCQQCGKPVCAATLSEMQSLEDIQASAFDVKCECGWSANWLGLKARKHWVDPWSDRDWVKPPAQP